MFGWLARALLRPFDGSYVLKAVASICVRQQNSKQSIHAFKSMSYVKGFFRTGCTFHFTSLILGGMIILSATKTIIPLPPKCSPGSIIKPQCDIATLVSIAPRYHPRSAIELRCCSATTVLAVWLISRSTIRAAKLLSHSVLVSSSIWLGSLRCQSVWLSFTTHSHNMVCG